MLCIIYYRIQYIVTLLYIILHCVIVYIMYDIVNDFLITVNYIYIYIHTQYTIIVELSPKTIMGVVFWDLLPQW